MRTPCKNCQVPIRFQKDRTGLCINCVRKAGLVGGQKGKPHASGYRLSPETRAKMSVAKKKKPTRYWANHEMTEEHKQKSGASWRGKSLPEEHRAKIQKTHIENRESHPNWKGGVTIENKLLRNRAENRDWRKKIFERDRYTCQICGQVGGELNADHIKSFSQFPELRLELSNGRTLCVECHKNTHNYAGRALRAKV